MDGDKRRVVTVFGSADPVAGSKEWDVACHVGRVLGEAGYSIANGGYGGTMEASAMGASEAGGHVTGVTCNMWKTPPNAYVDTVIDTESHDQRLHELVRLGEYGYIVLPGATGTLVELATVWELELKGFLPKARDGRERPVVCVGEFWSPLVDLMAMARESSRKTVSLCDTPEEILPIISGVL